MNHYNSCPLKIKRETDALSWTSKFIRSPTRVHLRQGEPTAALMTGEQQKS